jgi:tetratricopeptide (TPR) repeat protein
VKRDSVLFVVVLLAVWSIANAQLLSQGDEVPPRVSRLQQWLSAIDAHRPGTLDDNVRLINTWDMEQLRLIWVDVSTIVSLVREPSVMIFYVTEPQSRAPVTPARQVSPLATNRSTQVLYTGSELRGLRALAQTISPKGTPGPENEILKRGAMLHADIEILGEPGARPPASPVRPGPGGATLFMNDGQQLALRYTVSHWNMGRRLLDRVRPVDSKNGIKTAPDPGADETVRRWYVAGCAYMLRTRLIEPIQCTRALELFPNNPEVLFFAASMHESNAGVRTQAVMRSLEGPRDVSFDVREQGAELRRAEQLYKRALERDPMLIEARIRLGRVLGLRGRHAEAVEQLRQGLATDEPVLRFYAHLFLGGEFEALGNGPEARQSYERAAAIRPMAQSPLLGLSRVADLTGDRAAAREAIARVLKLPASDFERADPWWVYEVVQARGLDRLLADLRQRIATSQ